MVRAKTANDAVKVLPPSVADPTFIEALFKVYRKFSFMMIAVRALKKKLVVGPIKGPQHISQYL